MKRSEMITYLRKNIEWVDESPNWEGSNEEFKCDENFADYILGLVEKSGMTMLSFKQVASTLGMSMEIRTDCSYGWEPESGEN